ncbi:MAG: hypothetical protein FJX15_10935 [Alphaproteobacteria bacterium]|nr:hypothetical protein [Alphaproteobacteria bacterium]
MIRENIASAGDFGRRAFPLRPQTRRLSARGRACRQLQIGEGSGWSATIGRIAVNVDLEVVRNPHSPDGTQSKILIATAIALGIPPIWRLLPEWITGGLPFGSIVGDTSAIFALITAFGGVTETKARIESRSEPFRIAPSFYGGLYGGIVGGMIAGLIIGLAYFFTHRDALGVESTIVIAIVIYSVAVGAVLGSLSQLIILIFNYMASGEKFLSLLLNEVTGGLVGGATGGAIIGILGSKYFYDLPIPPIDIPILLIGAPVGAFFIVAGALLYNFRGKLSYVLPTILIFTVATLLCGVALGLILQSYGVGSDTWWSQIGNTKSGAILGVAVGAALGLEIGLTLLFYRLQQPPPFFPHSTNAAGLSP